MGERDASSLEFLKKKFKLTKGRDYNCGELSNVTQPVVNRYNDNRDLRSSFTDSHSDSKVIMIVFVILVLIKLLLIILLLMKLILNSNKSKCDFCRV